MAKEEKKYFEFNGKPFIRRGDLLYYGDPKDKYIVKFTVNSAVKAGDIDVSDSVTVQLVTNTVMSGAKERVIKQAQRDGLYRAFDVGEYWLSDALEALNSGR